MSGVNTILKRIVPIFLLSLVITLGSCTNNDSSEDAIVLTPDEIFVVEQYLRLVEARHLSASKDDAAESRWNFLAFDFPTDSLQVVMAEITARDPERWSLVFDEIVRRKKIMMNQP
ncbi:MAG: hypothetical protein GY835_06210 [bacterium]|nr:hypothetical protein [bacterium]